MTGRAELLTAAAIGEWGRMGDQVDLEGIAVRLDCDHRKALPTGKESINIGVLVSVFPGIP